ncbi:MAG: hypothetical protein U0793_02030 [Gemmataceae bacterium]
MPSRIVLFLCLCLPASAAGQTVDPPVAGRPPDFSGIVGQYRIQAVARPTEVDLEQPILLTVIIQGSGPAEWQPMQEKLRLFPGEADTDFFIASAPELKKRDPDKGVWEFVYRLRPKATEVRAIPSLKLVVYNPSRRRYQTSFADPIPITVKPAQLKEIEPKLNVVAAPEVFFQTRSDSGFSFWSSGALRAFEALALVGAPVVCVAGLLLWRRRHPNAEQARARQRSRAARLALQALKDAPDEAEKIGAVAGAYLRDRLEFPALEATPPEVALFLARRGAPKETQRRWATFFAQCAAQRFARSRPEQNHLRDEAMGMILALEDPSCLSA